MHNWYLAKISDNAVPFVFTACLFFGVCVEKYPTSLISKPSFLQFYSKFFLYLNVMAMHPLNASSDSFCLGQMICIISTIFV